RAAGWSRSSTRRGAPRSASPVDVPQDEIEAGEDGDDVRDVDTAQQPRHDRDVGEARGADLAPEGAAGRAIADHVEAHLAEGVRGVDPGLALRDADTGGCLGPDGPGRETIEELLDDARRLAHLLLAHPVPGERVPVRVRPDLPVRLRPHERRRFVAPEVEV